MTFILYKKQSGMKKINHSQLAFLLKCKVSEAKEMIQFYNAKQTLNTHNENGMLAVHKPVAEVMDVYADIDGLGESLGINLRFAINDIRDNYLTNPATKKYILSDWPISKMESILKAKDKFQSRIGIPKVLKSLLTDDQSREILSYLNNTYPEYSWE